MITYKEKTHSGLSGNIFGNKAFTNAEQKFNWGDYTTRPAIIYIRC